MPNIGKNLVAAASVNSTVLVSIISAVNICLLQNRGGNRSLGNTGARHLCKRRSSSETFKRSGEDI